MRRKEPMQPNLEDIEMVKKNSWLCRLFQEERVKSEEKVKILKAVTASHKKRRLLNES